MTPDTARLRASFAATAAEPDALSRKLQTEMLASTVLALCDALDMERETNENLRHIVRRLVTLCGVAVIPGKEISH